MSNETRTLRGRLGEALGGIVANHRDGRTKACAKALVKVVEIVDQLEAERDAAFRQVQSLPSESGKTGPATKTVYPCPNAKECADPMGCEMSGKCERDSRDDKNDERRTPRAWVWRQREGGSEFIMNLPPASPKEKEKYDGTALFFGDESAPAKLDIKALVNRFLAWPLPESVCSDMCATKQGYPSRVGTNLLTAVEARQMLEHVLAGLIPSAGGAGKPRGGYEPLTVGQIETCREAMKYHRKAGCGLEESVTDKLCDMATNSLLYAEEIDRLRCMPSHVVNIAALVNRFLGWPLPDSVCSDMCATMQGYPSRVGTNLLTANEARQMLEYVLRDFIPSNAANSETVAAALDRMIKSVEKNIAEQDPGNHSTIGFYSGELKGLKAAWYMLTKSDATESRNEHG